MMEQQLLCLLHRKQIRLRASVRFAGVPVVIAGVFWLLLLWKPLPVWLGWFRRPDWRISCGRRTLTHTAIHLRQYMAPSPIRFPIGRWMLHPHLPTHGSTGRSPTRVFCTDQWNPARRNGWSELTRYKSIDRRMLPVWSSAWHPPYGGHPTCFFFFFFVPSYPVALGLRHPFSGNSSCFFSSWSGACTYVTHTLGSSNELGHTNDMKNYRPFPIHLTGIALI
jgi:hypothetical protein